MQCLLALALCASVSPAWAETLSLERSVKAAFLYKFLGFAEFPPSAFPDPVAPVVIGVAGADDIAAELVHIVAGRTVNGRAVAIRSLKDGETLAGIHLLFVAGADPARFARMARAAQQPVLLVTEAEGSLQQGSVINFKLVDERVRFEVSLDAAERSGVKLSSRLLTVAHQVVKGAP